jgi:hypothetical protein
MSAFVPLIVRSVRLRTSLQILLVRKHQQQRILHFSILDDPRELRPRLVDTVAVIRVDDEDKTLGAYTVMLACFSCCGVYAEVREGREIHAPCNRVHACSLAIPGTVPSRPNIPEK